MPDLMIDPLFDPAVNEEPYAYYSWLRDNDPVHLVPGTNTFLISRFRLIQDVVADTETFSNRGDGFLWFNGPENAPSVRRVIGGYDMPPDGTPVGAFVGLDPPDHGRQRKVVSHLFSSGALARRNEEFRALVDARLKVHLDGGGFDWMREIAEPLPMVMVVRILGLPDDFAPALREVGFAMVEGVGGYASEEECQELANQSGQLGPIYEAFEGARRGGEPGPDSAIGACAEAVAAGDLNEFEAIAILSHLVAAGGESTTGLLGTGARLLAEDQQLQNRLRATPSLVGSFVEEACRIDPPLRGLYRKVTRDTTLSGVELPAGAQVVLLWSAANHDRDAFTNPDVIDVDRDSPRHHLGFGWGIHLCLGAPLARLEAKVAFEQLLARTTQFRVDDTKEGLDYHRSLMVRRLVDLPLLVEQ